MDGLSSGLSDICIGVFGVLMHLIVVYIHVVWSVSVIFCRLSFRYFQFQFECLLLKSPATMVKVLLSFSRYMVKFSEKYIFFWFLVYIVNFHFQVLAFYQYTKVFHRCFSVIKSTVLNLRFDDYTWSTLFIFVRAFMF